MEKKRIIIADSLRRACPAFCGRAVYADIVYKERDAALDAEMSVEEERLCSRLTPEEVKLMPPIAATREAYHKCGKDPSRYRPSGEQLCRRVLQGKGLYRVSVAVDLLNLASMRHGYSIGGLDRDRIEGDTLTLSVGQPDEPYEGIGRGRLNIAGMPVYRDLKGGVATPTSDSLRTMLTPRTRHLLCLINGYDGDSGAVAACAADIIRMLRLYALSEGGEVAEQEF